MYCIHWRESKQLCNYNSYQNRPESSCPSLSSPTFCFFLHRVHGFWNDQYLQFATRSRALLTLILPDMIHPSHLGKLHFHAPTNAHPMHIRARVDATETTALKKVTVLTAHPNSFVLSSHRSEPSGQISGFQMGVRRGHVAGLATQVEDCHQLVKLKDRTHQYAGIDIQLDTSCNDTAIPGKKCNLGAASRVGVAGQDLDPDLEERQPHSAAEYLAALWLVRSWSWNIVMSPPH